MHQSRERTLIEPYQKRHPLATEYLARDRDNCTRRREHPSLTRLRRTFRSRAGEQGRAERGEELDELPAQVALPAVGT